jgi:hypothetical protein
LLTVFSSIESRIQMQDEMLGFVARCRVVFVKWLTHVPALDKDIWQVWCVLVDGAKAVCTIPIRYWQVILGGVRADGAAAGTPNRHELSERLAGGSHVLTRRGVMGGGRNWTVRIFGRIFVDWLDQKLLKGGHIGRAIHPLSRGEFTFLDLALLQQSLSHFLLL